MIFTHIRSQCCQPRWTYWGAFCSAQEAPSFTPGLVSPLLVVSVRWAQDMISISLNLSKMMISWRKHHHIWTGSRGREGASGRFWKEDRGRTNPRPLCTLRSGSDGDGDGDGGKKAEAEPTLAFFADKNTNDGKLQVRGGLAEEWVNQNHDGLAQKAGCPQDKLNEVRF